MSDEILSAVGHNDRTGEIAKTQFAGEHLHFNACVATYLNKTVTSVIYFKCVPTDLQSENNSYTYRPHALFKKKKKMLLFAGRNSLLELFPFAPVVYLHEELAHPRTKQE